MIDGNIWFKNLGILPELTEADPSETVLNINTLAVMTGGGTTGAPKPVVKCKWEWVETGTHGDDDINAKGLQIDPITAGTKTIHFYAIVHGSSIAAVYADIFHPDGTFKYQISLTKMDKIAGIAAFDATIDNPTIVKYNIGYIKDDIVYYIDRAEVREELLDPPDAYVYHGTADISYCQPAGKYRVDVVGVSTYNDWGTPLNNNFWYVPTIAIQTDFSEINYGAIAFDDWTPKGGDTDMGTPTKPTVRNTGNFPVELYVNQSDMGFGMSSGVWKVKFKANLGYPDTFGSVEYFPETETRIPGVLSLCTRDKMDFWIKGSKGMPGDPFSGTMKLIARQHGQPPYKTPNKEPHDYIDTEP
jgi:hypothetical protein